MPGEWCAPVVFLPVIPLLAVGRVVTWSDCRIDDEFIVYAAASSPMRYMVRVGIEMKNIAVEVPIESGCHVDALGDADLLQYAFVLDVSGRIRFAIV